MYKLTNSKNVLNLVRGDTLGVGDIFYLESYGHVLKTHTNFVNLDNPSQTWPGTDAKYLQGTLLPKGTVLTLTVQ